MLSGMLSSKQIWGVGRPIALVMASLALPMPPSFDNHRFLVSCNVAAPTAPIDRSFSRLQWGWYLTPRWYSDRRNLWYNCPHAKQVIRDEFLLHFQGSWVKPRWKSPDVMPPVAALPGDGMSTSVQLPRWRQCSHRPGPTAVAPRGAVRNYPAELSQVSTPKLAFISFWRQFAESGEGGTFKSYQLAPEISVKGSFGTEGRTRDAITPPTFNTFNRTDWNGNLS